jgi:hypothetical protein
MIYEAIIGGEGDAGREINAFLSKGIVQKLRAR